MMIPNKVIFCATKLYTGTQCQLINQAYRTNIFCNLYRRYTSSSSYAKIASLIEEHTEVTNHLTKDHLTPELRLHLITPNCPQWYSKEGEQVFQDPFWAFYWPGGQALTRYILDNRSQFVGRTVIDIGCGGGPSAIAAAMAGAKRVIANDIDTNAAVAVDMNMKLNHVTVEINTDNLIGHCDPDWDIMLLGDMFYDQEFANVVHDWVLKMTKYKPRILIGDPGRVYLKNHPMKQDLTKLVEYTLPRQSRRDNNGFTTGYVWEYVRSQFG